MSIPRPVFRVSIEDAPSRTVLLHPVTVCQKDLDFLVREPRPRRESSGLARFRNHHLEQENVRE